MIGGYSRKDLSGFRATTLLTIEQCENRWKRGKAVPVSGDATLRWIGGKHPTDQPPEPPPRSQHEDEGKV